MNNDKNLIPSFWVIAPASERGNFDWTEFRIRCLEECQEPLISQKTSNESIEDALSKKFVVHRKPDPNVLKQSLENAIKYRKVQTIFIDEGHHMATMSSGKRIKDQMEAVKSLANFTNTVLVLIGTYDLLDLLQLNAQLARRTHPIHFRRYKDNPNEYKQFAAIIKTFSKHLPLHKCIDLTLHCRYLFENSVGCVGVLKDWLSDALSLAWEENSGKLGLPQLKGSAYSKGVVKEMQKEIFEGETRVEEMFFSSIRESTNDKDTTTETTPSKVEDGQVSGQAIKREPKKKRGNGRTKPGTRNPYRDPVGEPIKD